jgi:tRNA-binding protein
MKTMNPAAIKPEIDLATFESIDVRVGTIEAVHDVATSQKLERLVVNFGDHTRTILAGMKKERDVIEEIVGKQALFVVNLPSRKMAGEISEGMLFDIGYADGLKPALAVPERPVPNGSRAG